MLSYILTIANINSLLSNNRIMPLNKKYCGEKRRHLNKCMNQKVRPVKKYYNKGFHRTTNKDMRHMQRR
jgi:hypothetical protein